MATQLECLSRYRARLAQCSLLDTTGERELCRLAAVSEYAMCVTGTTIYNTTQDVIEGVEDLGWFLQRHPEIVVGTVLIVGGVTMIAVLGPSALLVAVAV